MLSALLSMFGRHWRVGSFPELSHLHVDQRRSLLKRMATGRMYTLMIVRAVFFGACLSAFGWELFDRPRSVAAIILVWCAWAMLTATIYQLSMMRIRIALRATMMDELQGERLPVCLQCGFDLRESPGDRCPECNAPVNVKPE